MKRLEHFTAYHMAVVFDILGSMISVVLSIADLTWFGNRSWEFKNRGRKPQGENSSAKAGKEG